jgi:FlgN protein
LDVQLDNLVRDLIRLLGDLNALHGELAMHMRNKLDAIKRADSDQVQSITAREAVLAARAHEREGLRKQLADRIGMSLGLDKGSGRSVRLTDLAEKLPEPRRSQLLVAAAGLREKVREIESINKTSEVVTRTMLRHLSEVMQVMTAGPCGADVYGRTGHRQPPRTANVFEAVG